MIGDLSQVGYSPATRLELLQSLRERLAPKLTPDGEPDEGPYPIGDDPAIDDMNQWAQEIAAKQGMDLLKKRLEPTRAPLRKQLEAQADAADRFRDASLQQGAETERARKTALLPGLARGKDQATAILDKVREQERMRVADDALEVGQIESTFNEKKAAVERHEREARAYRKAMRKAQWDKAPAERIEELRQAHETALMSADDARDEVDRMEPVFKERVSAHRRARAKLNMVGFDQPSADRDQIFAQLAEISGERAKGDLAAEGEATSARKSLAQFDEEGWRLEEAAGQAAGDMEWRKQTAMRQARSDALEEIKETRRAVAAEERRQEKAVKGAKAEEKERIGTEAKKESAVLARMKDTAARVDSEISDHRETIRDYEKQLEKLKTDPSKKLAARDAEAQAIQAKIESERSEIAAKRVKRNTYLDYIDKTQKAQNAQIGVDDPVEARKAKIAKPMSAALAMTGGGGAHAQKTAAELAAMFVGGQ